MRSFITSLSFAGIASAVVNQITCGGNSYSYNSLAGYGFVPSNAKDKYGDTLGGFGSAIAIDQSTWQQRGDGSYVGTLFAVPDRGWNTQGTLNYANRIHLFNLIFTPKPSATVQNPASPNLDIIYQDSIILNDFRQIPFTGLDPTGITNFPNGIPVPLADYPGDGFGGAGPGGSRVSLDSEGIVLIPASQGGGFWISDEYGPYIYRYTASGTAIQVLSPPAAYIPRRNGDINFSSDNPPIYNSSQVPNPVNPTSGRTNNQGFEGLTLSPDGKILSALLQTALVQDGGLGDATSRYTRLVTWDVSDIATPRAYKEYVVPLPLYTRDDGSTRTAGQSEVHAVSSSQYLVLARDSGRGYGQGKSKTTSAYRHIDVFSTVGATDILGSSSDSIGGTVAPGGALNPGITPATYCPWLDFNINSELGKFGLHNGGAEDSGLLNPKWESIAIVPTVIAPERTTPRESNTCPAKYQKDVYIFSFSDNDFITQDGSLNGGKYKYADSSGYNVNNQALVFQATIPAFDY